MVPEVTRNNFITLLKWGVGLEIICGGYQSSYPVKPTFAWTFLAEQTLLHHISIELNFPLLEV